MLAELETKDKIVGIKQLRKALAEGTVRKVFVAGDADPRLTDPIVEQCGACGVEVERVPTMQELGRACHIEVGAAVAALLHTL